MRHAIAMHLADERVEDAHAMTTIDERIDEV
jgi:hypothetical protein